MRIMCRHRVQVLRSNDHEQLAIWSKTNSGARERERMTDWPRPNYKRIHNVHLFNQGNRFSIHYSSNKIAVKWGENSKTIGERNVNFQTGTQKIFKAEYYVCFAETYFRRSFWNSFHFRKCHF